MIHNPSAVPLKEICKLTRSSWVTWVEPGNLTVPPTIHEQYGLTATRQGELLKWLKERQAAEWLAGSLHSGRTRQRKSGKLPFGLESPFLYAFPNAQAQRVLLVGGKGLEVEQETVLRIFATCCCTAGGAMARRNEEMNEALQSQQRALQVQQRALDERGQAQREAEKRLVHAARLAAVGEMAAGIAHELNNPLTTVTGFLELALQELPEDYRQREELALALQEALRARQVVRGLLSFSRPSRGAADAAGAASTAAGAAGHGAGPEQDGPTLGNRESMARSDINELVSQVVTLMRHMIRASGVMLRMQLWDDLPWIFVDPPQIQQVLLNLMQNALQAMPNGGTLTIRTGLKASQGMSWVQLAVEDTGEGMSPEVLGKIFEPFFTTRPPQQGSGLGLAVSYGIIQSHGGYIEVESQLGEGSRFVVSLPVNGDGEELADERLTPQRTGKGSR